MNIINKVIIALVVGVAAFSAFYYFVYKVPVSPGADISNGGNVFYEVLCPRGT